ncbi:hypothetical protein [Alicyclobacillus fastidiosus]|uniref:Uncharacterized protein n=1 Tax=Alicyclobacillus fastidiosus TaxID=392011 RepID=A0ABV5AKW9_9BACL|nr:hypothetical protein [Alicyclobacillus fastidiosus]WEH09298.1 hypothetical protein PYS47_21920 [Alicyclobacillus fastidiosus]
MTPPPAVIQWLKANNMRAIPNDEYIALMAERTIANRALTEIRKEALGDDMTTIWCIADETLAVIERKGERS